MSKEKEAVFIVTVNGGTTHYRWVGDKTAIKKGKQLITETYLRKHMRDIRF